MVAKMQRDSHEHQIAVSNTQQDAYDSNHILFSNLLQSIHRGNCVAIIGAGVSVPDYPLWDELVRRLQRACDVRIEDEPSSDVLKIAAAAKRKNNDAFLKEMRAIFALPDSPKTASRYHLLARTKFKSFLTLNFDPLLISTFDQHRDVEFCSYPRLPGQILGAREVIHLHGRIVQDPSLQEDFVLTEEDFDVAYDPNGQRLHSLLQNTFIDHDVCFLGCKPTEPNVKRLLRACRKICGKHYNKNPQQVPRWFWLLESTATKLVKVPGVHTVTYPPGYSFAGFDAALKLMAEKKDPVRRESFRDAKSVFDPSTEAPR
jgi:hypothetical protein